jgi:hypothetical protein
MSSLLAFISRPLPNFTLGSSQGPWSGLAAAGAQLPPRPRRGPPAPGPSQSTSSRGGLPSAPCSRCRRSGWARFPLLDDVATRGSLPLPDKQEGWAQSSKGVTRGRAPAAQARTGLVPGRSPPWRASLPTCSSPGLGFWDRSWYSAGSRSRHAGVRAVRRGRSLNAAGLFRDQRTWGDAEDPRSSRRRGRGTDAGPARSGPSRAEGPRVAGDVAPPARAVHVAHVRRGDWLRAPVRGVARAPTGSAARTRPRRAPSPRGGGGGGRRRACGRPGAVPSTYASHLAGSSSQTPGAGRSLAVTMGTHSGGDQLLAPGPHAAGPALRAPRPSGPRPPPPAAGSGARWREGEKGASGR